MQTVLQLLQYLVRNAFIVIALEGSPFIESGKRAFSLLKDNFVKAVGLNFFGDFVLFIGKIFVVLISAITTILLFGVSITIELIAAKLL
jgi:hypothetical protein